MMSLQGTGPGSGLDFENYWSELFFKKLTAIDFLITLNFLITKFYEKLRL